MPSTDYLSSPSQCIARYFSRPHLITYADSDRCDVGGKKTVSKLQVVSFKDLYSDNQSTLNPRPQIQTLRSLCLPREPQVYPKCVLSHRYAVRTAENMIEPYRLTENDINYTPIRCHISARRFMTFCPVGWWVDRSCFAMVSASPTSGRRFQNSAPLGSCASGLFSNCCSMHLLALKKKSSGDSMLEHSSPGT